LNSAELPAPSANPPDPATPAIVVTVAADDPGGLAAITVTAAAKDNDSFGAPLGCGVLISNFHGPSAVCAETST